MCRRVECRKCGRPTFAGCGAHVEQVLGDVPFYLLATDARAYFEKPGFAVCRREDAAPTIQTTPSSGRCAPRRQRSCRSVFRLSLELRQADRWRRLRAPDHAPEVSGPIALM